MVSTAYCLKVYTFGFLRVALSFATLIFFGSVRNSECAPAVWLHDRDERFNPREDRDRPPQEQELPKCTVNELLPGLEGGLQSRWVQLAVNETRPREYDCTCPYTKASYFCPNGRKDYPSWVPKAVADNLCTPVSSDVLAKHPFLPGTSYLFYGNSHLRQVLEAIMCSHAEMVVRREVLVVSENHGNETLSAVPLDRHCRGCMTNWRGLLVEHGCVPAQDANQALRCKDDRAVFELSNNATVHYWFANVEVNKSVERALEEFDTSGGDYDVVVANVGNDPKMQVEHVVSAAQYFDRAGAQFLWLTTYDGAGDIRDWGIENRQAFLSANGKHIPVRDMMESMVNFTRGVAQNVDDPHFCLPGPPNELGILVLQVLRALVTERRRV